MTLTETAKFTKRSFVVLILLIFLSILAWFGYKYYHNKYVYLPSLDALVPKPDVNFGLLPYPNLKISSDSASLVYSVDTPTGSLPSDIPNILKVYFIPKGSITLLAPDRARDIARSFGLDKEPEIKSATEYSFSDNSGSKLVIDLETLNFKFRRRIATESGQLKDSVLADQGQLVGDFKKFIGGKGLLLEQLANSKSKVYYDATSNTDSNSALVTLWQDDIDKYQIVTPNFKEGLIKATVTKLQDENNRYSDLDFIYWPVDRDQFATYPIKSPTQAFDDLKSGTNVSIIEKPKKGNEVSLTDLYIAYLMDSEYTPFLQPVYVFAGVDFTALIPAIPSDYLR